MSNYNPNPISSHIPGTQAHREKKFAEHEQGGAFGVTGGAHLNAPGAGYENVPANPAAAGFAPAPGAAGGFQRTGGVSTQTGVHPAPATMSERADELHGRHHHGAATGTGMTSAGTTKPHLGDRVMGATQAAIGRATNNPALEQAGMERKTFGDPKHRPGNVGAAAPVTGAGYGAAGTTAPVAQQQEFQQGFVGTQPAQQAYTQPGAGTAFHHHAPPAGPPPGAY